MGNISNFNVNKIDLRLSNHDYWDFYLADGDYSIIPRNTIFSGECLVAHYDFNEMDIYNSSSGRTTIHSLPNSTWWDATNSGYTLPTIGLTGLDNGYLPFEKDVLDIANTGLTSTLTGTTLLIPSGETRLMLNVVTGYTGNFVYPVELITNSGSTVGEYSKLCGGFYQGYYKLDGYTYEVLPNRVPKTWTAEVWLRKSSSGCTGTTGVILNDVYTGNTGMFLYFGTRAENKFWNVFEGLNTGTTSGCTSGATEWCTVPKETDVSFVDDSGTVINLSPPAIDYTITDNKFLIYSRARSGHTVCTFTGDTITIAKTREVVTDTRNPFQVYSRARASTGGSCGSCGGEHPAGETVCTFSGFTSPVLELDRDVDLIDNALGFRVREDGAIGYRRLVMSSICVDNVTVTGCSVYEEYSDSGLITDDIWHMVSIRYVADTTLDECELEWKKARNGKLMIYVDGKLKKVFKNFSEFIARRLFEHKDKQLAVPFNISLGGGTQGLLEEMTFDGPDPLDLGSCLTENFAGTFIGDISQFRYYICGMNYCDISNNFEQEMVRYK